MKMKMKEKRKVLAVSKRFYRQDPATTNMVQVALVVSSGRRPRSAMIFAMSSSLLVELK
jgi:hypothetical protein